MTETPEPAGSNLVANEQIKLTATYLNGLAIAIFAVGGLAPLVPIVSASAQAGSLGPAIALAFVCVGTSGALHLTAKRHLKGLRE